MCKKGVQEWVHPVWWHCAFTRLSVVCTWNLVCRTAVAVTDLSFISCCIDGSSFYLHYLPKTAPLMIIWAPVMLQTWLWEYSGLDLHG